MAFDAGEIKGKLTIDKTQWDKSTASIKNSQKQMGVQAKKTGTGFAKMWKQVAIGAGVTTVLTRGIRAMGRQITDVFRKGREFEKEWANVTTMLSISRGETVKMRDELRRLSPTLGDTADLARGMYQVLSASIEPAKAIKFLGVAAKAAKAGITDTRTAVDAITTVINAYGMEAEDATEVSDIMFSTVKRGKLTFEEMARSLGTVVPVASKVGLNFKEVAAAMATLTRQGIDSRTATMQLRQVIMSILSPTEDAIRLAESLGFEWSADALRADGLAKILGDLEEKTGGNNELLKAFVPNVRALTAVMGLGGEAAEGFVEDIELMGEAAGKTNEAFGKQMETMDFWLEAAEVTADKWKIAFYEGLIDPMRESIRTADDFEEKFTAKTNEVADEISLHMGAVHEAISSVGKALAWLDKFAFGWGDEVRRKMREGSEEFQSHSQAMAEAMKLRQELINDEIITTKEWTAIFNEHGRNYAEVLKAIATLPEYEHIRNRWKEVKEEIESVTTISDEEMVIRIIPKIEMFGIETQELPSEIIGEDLESLDMVVETELSSIIDKILTVPADTSTVIQDVLEETQALFDDVGLGLNDLIENVVIPNLDTVKEFPLGFEDAALQAGAILSGMGEHSKALAIAGAIINTAMAVTMALRAYPPPLSFAMAAVQAAAGLAEITTIKGQSIPSAEEGAYVPKPAVVELGHGPMGEVILPLDKAPGMAQKIIIQNRIIIGEQIFYRETVRNVNKAGPLGDLIIPNKVVL